MKIQLSASIKCTIHRENDPQGGYRYRAHCPFLGITAKGDKKEDAKDNLGTSITGSFELGLVESDIHGENNELLIKPEFVIISSGTSAMTTLDLSPENDDADDSNVYWCSIVIPFIQELK